MRDWTVILWLVASTEVLTWSMMVDEVSRWVVAGAGAFFGFWFLGAVLQFKTAEREPAVDEEEEKWRKLCMERKVLR